MIRLLELRNDKELSQRTMAKELGISQATYNNWENGKTQPNIEQIIQLANFFEVSTDYLLGKESDVQNDAYMDEEISCIMKTIFALPDDKKTMLKKFIEYVL